MSSSVGPSVRAVHDLHGAAWEISRSGRYRGRIGVLGCMFFRRGDWTGTTAMQDCAEYLDSSQAAITPAAVGVPYYIVSTSEQDGPAGTGIRTVRVNCLVGAGLTRTIRTITMAGTTPVSLGSDVAFVQYMESASVGSGGLASGSIYCSSKATAGTPAVSETIDAIIQGEGRSMSGRVMVPGGFSLHLIDWAAQAVHANMDARLRGDVFTDDRSLAASFHVQETAWIPDGATVTREFHGLRFPEGAIVKVSAIPAVASHGNKCAGSFSFLLIEN